MISHWSVSYPAALALFFRYFWANRSRSLRGSPSDVSLY